MYVKLSFKNLNPGLYFPHPTNIYTCEVTTAPRVRNGYIFSSLIYIYIYIYTHTHLLNRICFKLFGNLSMMVANKDIN